MGVSDRAVSKWETGRSMPDTSPMGNYQKEAEENLVALQEKIDKVLSMDSGTQAYSLWHSVWYKQSNTKNRGKLYIIHDTVCLLFILNISSLILDRYDINYFSYFVNSANTSSASTASAPFNISCSDS